MKIPVVNRKKVNDLQTIRELQDYLDWLQPNSRKLMWHVFEGLQKELRSECYNSNKEWGNAEKESLKRNLSDPFSRACMSQVVAWYGRAPFSNYQVFILLVWEATKRDPKRVLLKRTIKSAVRYGYAQWDKSN